MSENNKIPIPPKGVPRLAPHLFYNDVGAALDWLEKAFGFKVRNRIVDKTGVVVHGELEIADALVMLGLTAEHAHWESPLSFGGKATQRLFIYIEDVDAHFQRARAAGAYIHMEPTDQWHGDRVYEAVDPEGHRWKFAQPIFEIDQFNLQRPDGL